MIRCPVPIKRPVLIPESDKDSSDKENFPLANLANNKKEVERYFKAPTEKIKWESNQLDPYNPENYSFTGETVLLSYIMDLDTPADFFLFIYTDGLLSNISDSG
ncbi:unnamed protein product [Euphydryas editha]|uniref:Uncharacterized protein n=1 Tax=Euphydryas editha TaxID=104508 RepID=A0AAU9UH13_EUPED|nr:unnamed protein product [Euphydryas editha]